jgi:myo-inositol catabolism protein IolC
MRRAIEQIQNSGVEVDVWKIEGVDEREDAQTLAEQTRSGDGREGVACVLLGRGASTEKVNHWLEQAAPVDGFIGFAIGRSIWWDALKAFLADVCHSPRSAGSPRPAGPGRLAGAWR